MSFRRQRVAHELRDRLAMILAVEVRDPRVSGAAVTGVDVSPDFSFARVFYRPLGDREAAALGLEAAKPFIRRRLAEGLTLRRVPELDFRLDESVDRGERIDEILAEIDAARGGSDEEER